MIEGLALLIGLAGAVLVTVLWWTVFKAAAPFRLSRHRSKDPGFADLLAYAAVVDDGVIVCKNGAFMAAWLYKAADNASSTDHERNAQAIKIAQALRGMGNGWMVHVDAVRRPAPHYSDRNVSHFPDPVSAAVDEERRRYFEALGTLYEGFFVITLTWFPPLLAQRKFIELMFDDESALQTKIEQLVNMGVEGEVAELCAFIQRSLRGVYGRHRELYRGKAPPAAVEYLPPELKSVVERALP